MELATTKMYTSKWLVREEMNWQQHTSHNPNQSKPAARTSQRINKLLIIFYCLFLLLSLSSLFHKCNCRFSFYQLPTIVFFCAHLCSFFSAISFPLFLSPWLHSRSGPVAFNTHTHTRTHIFGCPSATNKYKHGIIKTPNSKTQCAKTNDN